MTKSRMKYGFMLLLLAALPVAASAADLRFGPSDDEALYRVQANDQVRNLYAISGQLIVDANSSKDTVAIGAVVTINGTTAEDLIVFGGVVDIKNSVGGSVRVVGGNVTINGAVGEDLVVLGGSVYVSPNATVAGDLIVGAGNVIVDGSIAGDIKGATGALSINSTVGGDVSVKAANRFELGPNADIKGNLDYGSTKLLVQDDNAKVAGNITFRKMDDRAGKGMQLGWALLSAIAFLLAALLARYLLKRHFDGPVMEVKENLGRSLLTGLVVLIVLPIAAFIALLSMVGFYIGLMALFLLALVWMYGALVGIAALGAWVNEKAFNKPFQVTNIVILIGVVSVLIIKLIPLLGMFISFLVMLAGFGATIRAIRKEGTHGNI